MSSLDIIRIAFQGSIEAAFIEPRLTTSRGRVLAPLEPFDLYTALCEAAESVEEDGIIEYDAGLEALSVAFPSHTFLSFYWDGFGCFEGPARSPIGASPTTAHLPIQVLSPPCLPLQPSETTTTR